MIAGQGEQLARRLAGGLGLIGRRVAMEVDNTVLPIDGDGGRRESLQQGALRELRYGRAEHGAGFELVLPRLLERGESEVDRLVSHGTHSAENVSTLVQRFEQLFDAIDGLAGSQQQGA